MTSISIFFFSCTQLAMSFIVVFHHGGLFVREWFILYKGGKEIEVVIID
jgi:hypothetical protein